MGHSSGEIAAAYTAGMLTLESAVSVAYYRGALSSQLASKHGNPQGAMLAVGLSSDDVQSYIDDAHSGKATVACVNSPKSVTLSGDVRAIDELHSKFQSKGLFSRKLRINMAYHSNHMASIAQEYSHCLRDLHSQHRNPGVQFYSSVFPHHSVETNSEYWVQNLLLPVRFSDAIKNALGSQTKNDLVCIEIGPHSALAGPFKQICQSFNTEIRPEYLASSLRNEDGVEQALSLACSLFNNGWKVDLASINFPISKPTLRVLTDLPPYAWNHNTQYWHQGRLAQNYLHRKDPSHDILGTLLNDSSDIDMRWSNYIRLSELPWLKDHVVRSEVLFPAGGYLVMAMVAAAQKASMSSKKVRGYTLRDVTFSKALVVPDTSDGVELSLILSPFRQSAVIASLVWNEFRIISFGSDRRAYEHCHGLISVNYRPYFELSPKDKATLATTCDRDGEPGLYQQLLAQSTANGNEMGPSFQLVSKCCFKDNSGFFDFRLPNRHDHESSTIVSVPLMDAFLQTTVLYLAGTAPHIDGAIVPTSITELVVSESIGRDPGHILHSRGSTMQLGPRDFEYGVIVAQDSGGVLEPVVQIKEAKVISINKDQESSSDDTDAKLCWHMLWQDDVDDLRQEDVANRWPIPEYTSHERLQMVMCERAIWYCLRSAYENLDDSDVQKMAPHHRNYYNWMRKRYEQGRKGDLPFQKDGFQGEWSCTDSRIIEDTLQQVSASNALGCMTIRLGRRLLDVLRGEVEPLSLMLEDDLLNRYYAENRNQDRAYQQAARFVRLAAHRNPRLRILEIGAGTGYVSSWRMFSRVY